MTTTRSGDCDVLQSWAVTWEHLPTLLIVVDQPLPILRSVDKPFDQPHPERDHQTFAGHHRTSPSLVHPTYPLANPNQRIPIFSLTIDEGCVGRCSTSKRCFIRRKLNVVYLLLLCFMYHSMLGRGCPISPIKLFITCKFNPLQDIK